MKRVEEDVTVFSLGGIIYTIIEYLWRGYSHWTMMLTGSVCFLSIYRLFNYLKKISLPQKCVLGSLVITSVEFMVGCVVNLKLKLDVWDYSDMKFNLLGQVCLVYSVLWGLLCIPASVLVQKLKKIFYKFEISEKNC